MRSRGHVPVGRLSLIEGEYLVTGLMPLAAIAQPIASNICIEQVGRVALLRRVGLTREVIADPKE
jgi:hypothetical protein